MFIGLIFIIVGALFLISIFVPDFVIDFSYAFPLILIVSSIYYIIKGKNYRLLIQLSYILVFGFYWKN